MERISIISYNNLMINIRYIRNPYKNPGVGVGVTSTVFSGPLKTRVFRKEKIDPIGIGIYILIVYF